MVGISFGCCSIIFGQTADDSIKQDYLKATMVILLIMLFFLDKFALLIFQAMI